MKIFSKLPSFTMKSSLFSLFPLLVTPLFGEIVISEFLTDNDVGLRDEDGDREDWIEIFNSGSESVDLTGWWLSDSDSNPAKWTFPEIVLAEGDTLLIWASGKNRQVPGQPLHTNFKLSRGGEYLGIYQPDTNSGLPSVVQEFSPEYPPQVSDVSYGRDIVASETTLLATGSAGRYLIPTSQTQYLGLNLGAGQLGHGSSGGWNRNLNFDDSSWTQAITGIGYDTNGRLNSLVGTDIRAEMRNVNSSVLLRMKFEVPNPSQFTSLTLRIRYEDGAAVFFNGSSLPVAAFRAPNTLAYNSRANSLAKFAEWQQWTETSLDPKALVAGDNLLAIQGLNRTASSSDFLVLPEVVGIAFEDSDEYGYLRNPSPNSLEQRVTLGALISNAAPEDPNIPRPTGNAGSPPLTVSIEVLETGFDVDEVRVIPRVDYQSELSGVTLSDNGLGADVTAGDGVYTGLLPTNNVSGGQMLRWRFEVEDNRGTVTRWPAFRDPEDSPEYFGTVAARSDESQSQLPIMDWFVEGAPETGPVIEPFRGSMYYRGYFYDNIGHKIHGQSSRAFPKKSYDFDSNDGHRFDWADGERKVKDLNLLTNYADKTKTRNTLSHEIGSWMGTPYHFCQPIRVHLNSNFHGVMDLMEDGDDRMLERNGLDPEGSFYKIDNSDPSEFPDKKTRKEEPNNDLIFFSAQLDESRPFDARLTYAYDNVDIPATINYLVTRILNSDSDHGHKNYYLYRDTNESGLWRPIVWDVDLSQGHVWNGGNLRMGRYFNDALVTDVRLRGQNSNNRLYNLIFSTPEFRDMFVRRMRTAMDEILGAPGALDSPLELRMRQLVSLVDPEVADPSPLTDGDRDHARWSNHEDFADNRPRQEVDRVLGEYLPGRRDFLFNQGADRPLLQRAGLSGGTPLPDLPQSVGPNSIVFEEVDFLPSNGTQDAEYLILRNTLSTAVDISGWTLDGAIDYTFQGGAVIPAGSGSAAEGYRGLLHVVKNVFSFRNRTEGPRGGQRRLIQGGYRGQLSARGETVNLRDRSGQLIASLTYEADPTLAQKGLRISELQYHPAEPTAAESVALLGVNESDFEYLELSNISDGAIDLEGAYFGDGIEFVFPAISLPAGERLILARRPTAFALRYSGVTVPVVGPYLGELANGGERLQLLDRVGEVILDFDYRDGWYPDSDGDGRSLVVRELENQAHSAYGSSRVWGLSLAAQGSPGVADNQVAQAYFGWDNFHFTSVERDDELLSGPAADPDGDGRNNFEEYAFGTDPRTSDQNRISLVWWQDASNNRRSAVTSARPAHAIDVNYFLLAGENLESITEVISEVADVSTAADDIETLTYRDMTGSVGARRFYRLRAERIIEE